MNTSIYTMFYYSFIIIVVCYTVGILTYAYEHFRIIYNESLWEKATDEEVITKIYAIITPFLISNALLYFFLFYFVSF